MPKPTSAQALLDALSKEYRLDDPPPGAFTVADFARKIGKSRHTAKLHLESHKPKLRTGKFKAVNGKATVFYY